LTPSTAVALIVVVIAVLFTPNLKEFFAAKKGPEQLTVQATPEDQTITTPTSDELLLLREQKLLQQQQDVLTEYANLSVKVQELQVSLDELQQLVQARSAAFEAAK